MGSGQSAVSKRTAGASLRAASCIVLTLVWLGAAAVAAQGPAAPAATPPLSDQVFKNVQVLKGIPVDQFMDAMGMFSSSLGYDCSSCHSQEIHTDRAAFAIDLSCRLRSPA